MRPHRLAWPRTPAFHAGDRGSNPLGDATLKIYLMPYVLAVCAEYTPQAAFFSMTHNTFPFRVVAIARGITTILPGGDHEILPQDQVLIMASKQQTFPN
jgi:hypothetical protein